MKIKQKEENKMYTAIIPNEGKAVDASFWGQFLNKIMTSRSNKETTEQNPYARHWVLIQIFSTVRNLFKQNGIIQIIKSNFTTEEWKILSKLDGQEFGTSKAVKKFRTALNKVENKTRIYGFNFKGGMNDLVIQSVGEKWRVTIAVSAERKSDTGKNITAKSQGIYSYEIEIMGDLHKFQESKNVDKALGLYIENKHFKANR